MISFSEFNVVQYLDGRTHIILLSINVVRYKLINVYTASIFLVVFFHLCPLFCLAVVLHCPVNIQLDHESTVIYSPKKLFSVCEIVLLLLSFLISVRLRI